MAHVGQIPINHMSFFGTLANNQIFESKDGQVVTYVRANTTSIALIDHYFQQERCGKHPRMTSVTENVQISEEFVKAFKAAKTFVW